MPHMMDQDFFEWYWELPASYHKMVSGNDVGETRERRIFPKQACYKMASQQSGSERGVMITYSVWMVLIPHLN